jgi:peroxiredoxin Q/BCP
MTSPEESLVVLRKGDSAPEFEAELYPAGKFRLLDYRGKKNLILAFYPKDSTPGCTREMCAFSADLSKFSDRNTAVFGISCDSVDSHQRFTEKNALTVPLISDSDGTVGRLYGALREGRSSAERKLFVIDKNGKVQDVVDGMPDNEELLSLLATI